MSFSHKHLYELLDKIFVHQMPFIRGSAGCLYICRQGWLNLFLHEEFDVNVNIILYSLEENTEQFLNEK